MSIRWWWTFNDLPPDYDSSNYLSCPLSGWSTSLQGWCCGSREPPRRAPVPRSTQWTLSSSRWSLSACWQVLSFHLARRRAWILRWLGPLPLHQIRCPRNWLFRSPPRRHSHLRQDWCHPGTWSNDAEAFQWHDHAHSFLDLLQHIWCFTKES